MIGNFWTTFFWAHKEDPPGSGNIKFCAGCTELGCGPCGPTCFACSGCPCLDGPDLTQQITVQAHIQTIYNSTLESDKIHTCPTGQPTSTCDIISNPYCCQESWEETQQHIDGCYGSGVSLLQEVSNVGYRGVEPHCPVQPPSPCISDPNPRACGRGAHKYACCSPGCGTCFSGASPGCLKSECGCFACTGQACTMREYEVRLTGGTCVVSSLYRVRGSATSDEVGNPCGFSTETLVQNTYNGVGEDGPCGNANTGMKNFGFAGYANEDGEYFWNGMKFTGIPSTDANPWDMQYECPGTLFVAAKAECGCGPQKQTGCDEKVTCAWPGPWSNLQPGCFTTVEALWSGSISTGQNVTYTQVGRYCRTSRVGGNLVYRSGGEIVQDLPAGYVNGINRGVISPTSFTIRCL